MDIVTIDFETYYDREYSLSKLTTEAYIRDPRFEIIGVGVKINDGPTDWYDGSQPDKFLGSLDYARTAVLCHNTAFDGAIMSWHMGIRPKLWLDTLSMARPRYKLTVGGSLAKLAAAFRLGQKGTEVVQALGKRQRDFTRRELDAYGDYCRNDVDLTYALFRKLAKGFPPQELALIDLTLRMFTEPEFELDRDILQDHIGKVRAAQETLLLDLGRLHNLGDTLEEVRAALASNPKFADVLTRLGVRPPLKPSPSNPAVMTYAFAKKDDGLLALEEHEDERVRAVVAARLGVKSTIEETRTERLLNVAARGRLPILLNYYGAHTGRFSGGDKMNLQNLPRGGALRRSLRAPKGKVLVAADSSQIEARVVAWLSGQGDLMQAFREKRDIYCEFATRIFGRKITEADTRERFVGKTCILGLGFGMGAAKFRDTLAVGQGDMRMQLDADEAARIVRLYRETYSYIERFWKTCNRALDQIFQGGHMQLSDALPTLVATSAGIMLPSKLPITYPCLTFDKLAGGWLYAGEPRVAEAVAAARMAGERLPYESMTRIYGGKVTENIVQAVARIVVTEQMLRIATKPWAKVVLQVHDEVVISVDQVRTEEAVEWMRACMFMPPAWAPTLPVACKVATGQSYGECK